MGSGAPQSTTPPARSPRPPVWFFAVVAALVLAGIAAPLGVSWYQHRVAATVPVDTTGNSRRDSLRNGTALDTLQRRDSARAAAEAKKHP